MAAMSTEAWGIALLIAFEVPNLFSGLLPSLFTISTFGGDESTAEHTRRWIRRGETQAGIVSLGLGLGGAIVTKSPVPMVLTLGMIVWLVWQYEAALRASGSGPKLDMRTGAGSSAGPEPAFAGGFDGAY